MPYRLQNGAEMIRNLQQLVFVELPTVAPTVLQKYDTVSLVLTFGW